MEIRPKGTVVRLHRMCFLFFAHVADSTLREVGAWAEQNQTNQTTKPHARYFHTMVYDSTQQAWEQSDRCYGC